MGLEDELSFLFGARRNHFQVRLLLVSGSRYGYVMFFMVLEV